MNKQLHEDILEYITAACKNIMQNSCLDSSQRIGLGLGIQTDMCSKMKVYFKDGKLDYTPVTEVLSDKLGFDVICANLSSVLALYCTAQFHPTTLYTLLG